MPNQYSDKTDWSKVPWSKVGRDRRRLLLIEEADHKCSQCGWNKVRADGGCPLEIDHINGDHTDNRKENLRVLCPNCHSLTPNFRNWGRKGKKKTSKRIRSGNIEYEPKYTLE